jgi:arylsulfatase A-like enzyme
VVVVSSDHGEELFDHGGVLHGYTLYEEQLRVPLVIWGPGRVPPGETGRVTDTYDLHATLFELAGVGAGSGPAPECGAPRLHFAAADGPPGGAFAVRWGRWKYVRVRGTPGGWAIGQGPARSWRREYLFDLESDPGETRNLSGSPGHKVVEGWLRTTLREWVEARRSESRNGEPPEEEPERLTPEERERLRALGYVD